MSILSEIKAIRDQKVAEKQDKAKLNQPIILEKIKQAANRAESKTEFDENFINEYDKKLLEQEGFRVYLENSSNRDNYDYFMPKYKNNKIWVVSW